MIELKNITKSYEEKIAVNGISIKIDKGEIVGFLGPNGAGKSTTMKMITGFILPDSGEIIVNNKNLKDNLVETKALIGYMPENNPLYKEMLVKDAIKFALELHQIPAEKHADRIDYVVKATGIQKVYYRPISELSKGYKQRVGLAQVLVHDPEILILDEPTEGLDPNQRAEIRDLIKNLGKDRTVIISTHVMQEVEAMCNRIIIVKDGEVIADGSKDEVLKSKKGGSLIKLKVKSLKAKVQQQNFSNVKADNIEIKAEGSDMYNVELLTSKDIFESLTKIISQNNWVVYELVQKQENLEDIFRELTK